MVTVVVEMAAVAMKEPSKAVPATRCPAAAPSLSVQHGGSVQPDVEQQPLDLAQENLEQRAIACSLVQEVS
jgi:hypothetical protein